MSFSDGTHAKQLAAITHHRLIPVIVLNDAAHAPVLADALITGGLPVAEVALRTPCALDAIRSMASKSDLLVGAGTVLSPEHVDQAVEAGARFIVSPGLNTAVLEQARERDTVAIPGCSTASEIMKALELGVTTVKFFPAEASGGAPAVKALASAFGDVSFIPTGGINPANLDSYLALPCVSAVGGSWMAPRNLIENSEAAELTELIRASVRHAATTKG